MKKMKEMEKMKEEKAKEKKTGGGNDKKIRNIKEETNNKRHQIQGAAGKEHQDQTTHGTTKTRY